MAFYLSVSVTMVFIGMILSLVVVPYIALFFKG
jgi:hypothetical protein